MDFAGSAFLSEAAPKCLAENLRGSNHKRWAYRVQPVLNKGRIIEIKISHSFLVGMHIDVLVLPYFCFAALLVDRVKIRTKLTLASRARSLNTCHLCHMLVTHYVATRRWCSDICNLRRFSLVQPSLPSLRLNLHDLNFHASVYISSQLSQQLWYSKSLPLRWDSTATRVRVCKVHIALPFRTIIFLTPWQDWVIRSYPHIQPHF